MAALGRNGSANWAERQFVLVFPRIIATIGVRACWTCRC